MLCCVHLCLFVCLFVPLFICVVCVCHRVLKSARSEKRSPVTDLVIAENANTVSTACMD